MFSIVDCDISGTTTEFVKANDMNSLKLMKVLTYSSCQYFLMSFVINQEAMYSFNHPISSIDNLALDSNSSANQPLDGKSTIFSSPEKWNHNLIFVRSVALTL